MRHLASEQRGSLLVLVLVLGSVLLVMALGLVGFLITQYKSQEHTVQKERAREIAEAGLNYYKWYLAHYPDDTTHGTSTPGPYVSAYEDPELGEIGTYSLEITSSSFCGTTNAIDIYSTGETLEQPGLTRTVFGRYARPTVAEYSFIINSNVWAGPDRTIIGPYYSNGGIRMDGVNNSTVVSGQESWTCTASFGCTPDRIEDGVFGAGPNSHLWTFPAPPINFTGLTTDLAAMRDSAINNGGIFLGNSGAFGYRLVFNNDSTVSVYQVTGTNSYRAFSIEEDWHTERNVVSSDTLVATHAIPEECPLIFAEDKLWIEGTVSPKVTVAAANPSLPGSNYSVIINGSISYEDPATSGLLAVAEENVLIGLVVPDDMQLNGIFVAQNGRFGRNHYCSAIAYCGSSNLLPMSLRSYAFRNSLTMNGTIVSNGRVGTKWNSGGIWVSGFNTRFNSYDRNLVDNPPPLTPRTSDDYNFIEWRDIE